MKYARPVRGFQSTRQAHPYLQRLTDPRWSVTPDPGTEAVSTVILHHNVRSPGEGYAAVQYGHDVRVAGEPPHRSLLMLEVVEVDIVRIGTEHLHRNDAVTRRFVAAIPHSEPAAAHRLGIVIALCLELGNYSRSRAGLSGVRIGHS